MKTRRTVRSLIIGGLVLLACFLLWRGYRGMTAPFTGEELPPHRMQAWLAEILREDFDWPSLPASAVEKGWTVGFRSHITIFRVKLSPDQFASLREAVLSKCDPGDRQGARQDLSGNPLVPNSESGFDIPSWWDPQSSRHFQVVEWWASRADGRDAHKVWLCYDPDRQILFVGLDP
ncbi:hypothetical protein BH09VER1_BH09VER1_56020 [soil metagenome]